MKITPLDVRKQEFKITFKGFDKNEVNVFLEMIAKEMEDLIKENNIYMEQLRDLDSKIEDYRRMEKTLQNTLTSAQKTTDELRRNAEKESELILRNARIQADHILEEARSQVNSIRSQITSLKTLRDTFVAQFRALVEAQLQVLNKNWEELDIEEITVEKKKRNISETEGKEIKHDVREPLKGLGDLFR
ncbi:MAG: DivIVA domain-containing protein [Candidatus Cloacimonadota bacterium]|nr:MAG: DivIVA domain-containing protein [Candidatus Cloacimonadota bacterium]